MRTLALHAFEALEGLRSIAQLSSAITVGVARALAEQRRLLRERSDVYRDARRGTATPGRLHLCRTELRSAEAAVVLHTNQRAYAVAMSLEWVHGRWRACALWVL